MYKIKWKNVQGDELTVEVKDLSLAIAKATELGIPVTINGGGMEIVGVFGSDSVKDGMLPDGTEYSWYKRRRP